MEKKFIAIVIIFVMIISVISPLLYAQTNSQEKTPITTDINAIYGDIVSDEVVDESYYSGEDEKSLETKLKAQSYEKDDFSQIARKEEDSEFVSTLLLVETDYIDQLSDNSDIKSIDHLVENIYVLEYTDIEKTKIGYENLLHSEYVKSVMKDKTVSSSDVTIEASSRRAENSWGYKVTGLDHYTDFVNDIENNRTIYVAVLDTGINPYHEVFQEKKSCDRIDMTHAYNYVNDNNDVSDVVGHGTAVASVIAESTPPYVKIVPIKVLDDNGEGKLIPTYQAIYDIRNYVDVINLSLSAPTQKLSQSEYDWAEKMLSLAYDGGNGPIMVAAAGNESYGVVGYPAYSQYTIGVSALTKGSDGILSLAEYSNYGNQIDVSAPGTEIIVANAKTNNGYVVMDGTSFAAPYISATVALIKLESNLKTLTHVREKLADYSVDKGPTGKDPYYGVGSLNLCQTKFKWPAFVWVKSPSNNYNIGMRAICDEPIVKYFCVKDGQTANWIDISNGGYRFARDFDVADYGTYRVGVMDSSGEWTQTTVKVDPIVTYATKILEGQKLGYVKNGDISGTTGEKKRIRRNPNQTTEYYWWNPISFSYSRNWMGKQLEKE